MNVPNFVANTTLTLTSVTGEGMEKKGSKMKWKLMVEREKKEGCGNAEDARMRSKKHPELLSPPLSR